MMFRDEADYYSSAQELEDYYAAVNMTSLELDEEEVFEDDDE